MTSNEPPLLQVEGLKTSFFMRDGVVPAVNDLSYEVRPGETLAIVGESGCGKSVSALSIMRLVGSPGRVVGGTIRFGERNLLDLTEAEMRDIRGNEISMVFQEPMTSLNPVLTIGRQIAEPLMLHQGLAWSAATERGAAALDLVHIPDARRRLTQYPHELSGGMRQRVMIAMALACNPKLLIADEPTTALDVTIQAQILDLLRELRGKTGMSIILITHDLGVVAEMADRVVVMYAGRKVEDASAEALFRTPRHPYTRGLLASRPRLGSSAADGPDARLTEIPGVVPPLRMKIVGCAFAPRCPSALEICRRETPQLELKAPGHLAACFNPGTEFEPAAARLTRRTDQRGHPAAGAGSSAASAPPLLQVERLTKQFAVRRGVFGRQTGVVRAVDDVSFTISEGETLGLVGESGCGKSTVGKAILKLINPTTGKVYLRGDRIDQLSRRAMRRYRRDIQVVFQDPYSSLNPSLTAGAIVAEPLINYGLARGRLKESVADIFVKVGLRADQMSSYPYEFSGGQRQRIGIARALAVNPRIVICDEPVSALDVSVQAQVVNLLKDLQQEFGLSYLLIAHDLAVVEHISHRVAVMYLGKIVELTDRRSLFASPLHPYTEALLSAVPIPVPGARSRRIILKGDIPSPINPPSGCHFQTRCPYAEARCRVEPPSLREVQPGHHVACHLR